MGQLKFDEAGIRRFFLGQMTEEEREAFETIYIESGVDPEEVAMARYELIEEYIFNNLNPEEKILFETFFLQSQQNRRIFEESQALIKVVHEGKKSKEEK